MFFGYIVIAQSIEMDEEKVRPSGFGLHLSL
jgi:hypothetical protein